MIVIEGINHIGLTVSNLDASIQFYRDLFDFEVIEKMGSSGIAFLRMGDIVIGLYEDEGYKNTDETSNRISFFVDEEDFDDAIEELEHAEIEITYGPENIRGGQLLVFCDPDGNQIELSYPKVS